MINIFVTGGTFDKEYDELNGELFFKGTHLREMLKIGRCEIEHDIKNLMMIDSIDMVEVDREIIAENCKKSKEKKIVITHGTDTMVETAKVIAKTVKGKTIILTGAMVPYKFGSSDGMFNLGCAIGFVQALPAGVYIVMNGKYFRWNNVKKDKQAGKFVQIK